MEGQSFLNSELFQKTFENYFSDNVEIVEYESKSAVPAGENFTSDMYRVTVKYILGNSKRVELLPVLVKCRAEDGSKKESLTVGLNMFEREEEMFTVILPKLHKILGSDILGARCYYSERQPHVILIIEDLCLQGFRMVDRYVGFDLDHCLLALKCMARMHTASVILHKKEPHCYKIFCKSMLSEGNAELIKKGFTALIAATYRWPGFEKYGDKLMALGDQLYKRTLAASKINANGFNVLNHGGLWINNMLFKYNTDGKVEDIRFVDFQVCIYTSPSIDLHYFLCTSPSIQTHRIHYDLMIKYYHENLLQAFADIQHPLDNIPTIEQLKTDLMERAFYGVCALAVTLAIVKVSRRNDATFNDIMQCDVNEGILLDMYTNERYSAHAQYLLHYFDENGVLE